MHTSARPSSRTWRLGLLGCLLLAVGLVAPARDAAAKIEERLLVTIADLYLHTDILSGSYDQFLTVQSPGEPYDTRPRLWHDLQQFFEVIEEFVELGESAEQPAELEERSYPLFELGRSIHEQMEHAVIDEAVYREWGTVYALMRSFARDYDWPNTYEWNEAPKREFDWSKRPGPPSAPAAETVPPTE